MISPPDDPFTNDKLHAVLALEDGTLFHGTSIGAAGYAVGEVVFNTSMTGYQGILTDPSYHCQLVTLTYPHFGNTDISTAGPEGGRIHAAGLIIRDLSVHASNDRCEQGLSAYMKAEHVVGIANIDTRKLSRILREKGTMNGAILVAESGDQKALALARSAPYIISKDPIRTVATRINAFDTLKSASTPESLA